MTTHGTIVFCQKSVAVHLEREGCDVWCVFGQDGLHPLHQILDDGKRGANILLRVSLDNRIEIMQLDFALCVPKRQHRAVERDAALAVV